MDDEISPESFLESARAFGKRSHAFCDWAEAEWARICAMPAGPDKVSATNRLHFHQDQFRAEYEDGIGRLYALTKRLKP